VKKDGVEGADEIYVLLGEVITQILKPGEDISPQEIIGALYRAGLRASNPEIQLVCEKAIQLLAKKLN